LNCGLELNSFGQKEVSWKPFVLSLSKHVAATFVMRIASLEILRLCPSTGSGRTVLTTKFQTYAGRINKAKQGAACRLA